MLEPFDISIGNQLYSIFPEEDDTFTVFKNEKEYVRIQKDTELQWLKLDYETDLPVFEEDQEINDIGEHIAQYLDSIK